MSDPNALRWSTIGLAHGKGHVTVALEAPGYGVVHYDRDGAVIAAGTIELIEGEQARDVKARALSSVDMLMHWPALLADVEHDRKRRPNRNVGGVELRTSERVPRGSGLILP